MHIAVEQMDGACAQRLQRQHRTARRAAGAQQHRAFAVQFTDMFAQAFRQPDGIGVAAFDAGIGKDQQVGSAGRNRQRIIAMRQRKGGFLVRHGDIDAAKAGPARPVNHTRKIFDPGRQWYQRAVKGQLVQPVALQHGRQGMADRPSHHASNFRLAANQ